MNIAERLERWNLWYERMPEEWRFQTVFWPVLIVGAINMLLTVSTGFPFGLLVVLAILAVAAVRVPYLNGWIKSADAADAAAEKRIAIEAVPLFWDLNLWYDGLPEHRRPFVILAVLVVAGVINMLLTIHQGFAFGILFLLALLVLIWIRAPYAAGWLIPPAAPQGRLAAAPPVQRIAQETVVPAAPLHIAAAEPATTHGPRPVAQDNAAVHQDTPPQEPLA